ncbi:hypothetical protein [uncultured Clostridium sp.]|uniref:hypothetical protein n=1 Tax=uncultured Clostridium sp. TaxID=59620 RepID=UPI002672ABF8|nr:hypothetical protein [uncultured Clostridium sp.]
MKKKFLSLMMAAAVVATTSVSAFAADSDTSVTMPPEANVTSLDTDETRQEITITGKVQDNAGNMPKGNFKVTVPTAASFTVNQAGNLIGPTLKVKNEGSQAIKVLAQDFENVGSNKIKVIGADAIANDISSHESDVNAREYDRKIISLRLEGDSNVVHLSASEGKHGISSSENLSTLSPNALDLVTLQPGDKKATTKTISLKGTAGSKPLVGEAVSDEFRLTLKIKKAD